LVNACGEKQKRRSEEAKRRSRRYVLRAFKKVAEGHTYLYVLSATLRET
jgi:hypothetical protein